MVAGVESVRVMKWCVYLWTSKAFVLVRGMIGACLSVFLGLQYWCASARCRRGSGVPSPYTKGGFVKLDVL